MQDGKQSLNANRCVFEHSDGFVFLDNKGRVVRYKWEVIKQARMKMTAKKKQIVNADFEVLIEESFKVQDLARIGDHYYRLDHRGVLSSTDGKSRL